MCGAVRFEITESPVAVVNCHCSMCRKHHGVAFVTWAVIPATGFRFTAGQQNIGRYASSTQYHRSFCKTCGSVAPEPEPTGANVIIPAGNIEEDIGLEPQMHMFVGSKAPWFEIADGLPQHAAYPPELGMQAVPREPLPARAGVASGSCLCGGAAYEIDGPPMFFMWCHCSRCRLARGAAHATNMFFKADVFRWTRGRELVVDFPLPGAQFFSVAFCRDCGSSLPRVATERNIVNVPAGSLDSEPGVKPLGHIYVDSKAAWDRISGDIPQFAEMPPRR